MSVTQMRSCLPNLKACDDLRNTGTAVFSIEKNRRQTWFDSVGTNPTDALKPTSMEEKAVARGNWQISRTMEAPLKGTRTLSCGLICKI